MSADRRISATRIIQRIKQREIDECASQLGVIRREQADIQRDLDDLKIREETEAYISSPEAAPFLVSFLRAIETQRTALNQRLKVLDKQASSIETDLLEKFSEAHTNKTVLNNALNEKAQVVEKAERAALDEIASTLHFRQIYKL